MTACLSQTKAARKRQQRTDRTMAHQLDFFDIPPPPPRSPSPPLSADPLIGLAVQLPDECRCASSVAVIGAGSGPHCAELRCRVCNVHRGWLSHETHSFLTEITNKFGCPAGPIVIRRGSSSRAPQS